MDKWLYLLNFMAKFIQENKTNGLGINSNKDEFKQLINNLASKAYYSINLINPIGNDMIKTLAEYIEKHNPNVRFTITNKKIELTHLF